jgi:hypothetical protein
MNSRAPIVVVLIVIAALIGISVSSQQGERRRLYLTTPYQAVMLINGQTLVGKLENPGSPYPRLEDVFYIQSQVNPDTKQVSTNLVKRGKELHEPAYTIINANQILLIEPVKPESRLGKLIEDFKIK